MIKNFKNIIFLSIPVSLIVIFSACPTPQQYSEIPEIKFKQVELYDTIDDPDLENPVKVYKLRFGIIDGDGDIGLNLEDTLGLEIDSIYVNNFISALYEIKNGDTIFIADSLDSYNYRVPYVVPQGQNKTLIADIYINYEFLYQDDTLLYDSVLFIFYMIDRAINKSNVEKTPVLKLDTIGLFPRNFVE